MQIIIYGGDMEDQRMKDNGRKETLFVLYIVAVLFLAVIYFTVPERKEFLDFQLKWWGEMWNVIKGGQ